MQIQPVSSGATQGTPDHTQQNIQAQQTGLSATPRTLDHVPTVLNPHRQAGSGASTETLNQSQDSLTKTEPLRDTNIQKGGQKRRAPEDPEEPMGSPDRKPNKRSRVACPLQGCNVVCRNNYDLKTHALSAHLIWCTEPLYACWTCYIGHGSNQDTFGMPDCVQVPTHQ